MTGRGQYDRSSQRRDYQSEIARLDSLSRTRALTDAESIMLERLIARVERKGTRRASYGSNKTLARAGVKRIRSIEQLLRLPDQMGSTQPPDNEAKSSLSVDRSKPPLGDNAQAGA